MNPWRYPQSAATFYSPVSSHYAQAYLQSSLGGFQHQLLPTPSIASSSIPVSASRPQLHHRGAHQCTYHQCTFSGSRKVVETHMMDRHLLYPPSHNKNKQRDWDTDPALKGKPVIIQGTSVTLNTPEDIEAWIAERQKRFPTADRVADKKNKLEEAIARGQLPFDDNPRFPKRPRLEEPTRGASRGRGRGRGHGRGGRVRRGPPGGHDRTANSKVSETLTSTEPNTPALSLTSTQPPPSVLQEDCVSSDPDDAPPEALPTRPIENAVPEPPPSETSRDPESTQITSPVREKLTESRRLTARQPRGPPPIPFGQNTSLLRNLLLPEIRNTISNLSQAIRFLVDNDFLENVELKPGDAERQKNRIQVLPSAENSTDAPR